MVKIERSIRIALVLIPIVLVVISYLTHYHFGKSTMLSALAGSGTSLVMMVVAYASLKWAMERSQQTFLSVTFAGMFFRFLLFLGMFYLVHQSAELELLVFILAFFVFYLVFQYVEIRAFNEYPRQQK